MKSSQLSGVPETEFLFIEPSVGHVERALDSWRWIGLDDLEPVAVSAFGEVFFRALNGSIHHLEMIDGRLEPIAPNWESFATLLQDANNRDDLLLAGMVISARQNGLILDQAECYDFKIAPVLGGEIGVQQIEKTLFVVKVHIAGQIHRQVKDLPPGTKINKVTIGDR